MSKWQRFRWFLAGVGFASLTTSAVVVANPSGLPVAAALQRIEEKLDQILEYHEMRQERITDVRQAQEGIRELIEGEDGTVTIRRAADVPRVMMTSEIQNMNEGQ